MLDLLHVAAEATKDISQSWVALIAALLGGSGLKAIEYFLNKHKVEEDSATSFRKELREEVTSLREELGKVNKEMDTWRDRYYALMDTFIAFKGQLDQTNSTLKKAGLEVEDTNTNNPRE